MCLIRILFWSLLKRPYLMTDLKLMYFWMMKSLCFNIRMCGFPNKSLYFIRIRTFQWNPLSSLRLEQEASKDHLPRKVTPIFIFCKWYMFVYFLNLVFNECLLYINSQERCNTLSGLIYWWGANRLTAPRSQFFIVWKAWPQREVLYLTVCGTDRQMHTTR